MSNVYIEIKIVLRGGAAIQEHPAPHDDETYASVWRTDLQRCLCSTAPCAQQVRIQQWKFGATAVKPTVLRTMGISRAAGILHRHEVPGAVRPTSVLAGLDTGTGDFRTAQAKEYPTGLCRALVATMLEGLAQRRRRHGDSIQHVTQLGERERDWLCQVSLQSRVNFAAQFLPDYQPTTG